VSRPTCLISSQNTVTERFHETSVLVECVLRDLVEGGGGVCCCLVSVHRSERGESDEVDEQHRDLGGGVV